MIKFDFIKDNALVTVDSAPIIYLLEDHPQFAAEFLPLFQMIETGQIQAVVSPVTIAEVVAGHLNNGDEILANRYYEALSSGSNWHVQELTAEISFRLQE